MSSSDTMPAWQYERQQRSVIAEAVDKVIDRLYWPSDDYRDDLERLHRSGLTSLQTNNCLGASPNNGLEKAWQDLVKPLAEFTKDEKERKFMLSQALLGIAEEAFRKYGKFSWPPGFSPARKI